MSELNQNTTIDNDDELEQLLSHAKPRTVPDDVANAAVRRAVHAEWRQVTGRHQRRGHTMKFAIAASILVAVFSVFSVFRPVTVDLVQVASIQKSFGSIHFLGEQSVLTKAGPKAPIHQGQTIVTQEDSGLALAWDSGGSLRIDKNTTVEFQNDGSVFLHSGRVYFDSQPSDLIAGVKTAKNSTFVIETENGQVTHIGTQFMAAIAADALTVSVREGRVMVDGRYADVIASRGQQIEIVGRQQPTILAIDGYGDEWAWVGQNSPPINVAGRSNYDYLEWIVRELGYEVDHVDANAKQRAAGIMKGDVTGISANDAFLQFDDLTGLRLEVKEGQVHVSNYD